MVWRPSGGLEMISPTRAHRTLGRPTLGYRPRLEHLELRQLLTGNDTIDHLIGASAARALYKVDGAGLSAAMIDTGVDYTHPALGGDGFGPGHKVVDGYNFAANTANPFPIDTHGTLTAGIVASTDPTYPGIAPGASIVALRVFADNGSGDFNNVARALQYALDNHEKDNISVVNISISDGGNYSYDFFSNDNSIGERLAGLIHKLELLNIPVVTAAGNSYNGVAGMGFPSILSETVSVAATDKNDAFLPNAQRLGARDGYAAATDVVAPGKDFSAPTIDRRWVAVDGSSFSAPIVTGSILLLQDIYKTWYGTLPKVDDLVAWIKGGATTIHDDPTGTDYGRIDILKSASLIPKPASSPPAGPTTEVYVDGLLQATVPADTTANPLSDFGKDAGYPINFELIQLWQNGQSTTISLPANTRNDLAEHFTKVEIYNAQTTGTFDDTTVRDLGASQDVSSNRLKNGLVKAFRSKLPKVTAAGKLPKPSRFGRGLRRR